MDTLENLWLWEKAHLPLLAVLFCGGMLILYLLDFYRPGGSRRGASKFLGAHALDFEPESLGGSPYAQLAWASLLGLYLELLMIRLVSSEIRIFAYLKNFVLIACFLGFGLGCYLCRRRINLAAFLLPLIGVTLLVSAPWAGLRALVVNLQGFIGKLSEVETWGLPSLPRTWDAWGGLLVTIAVALPLFAVVALTFVPLGQIVGGCLERGCKGIRGYTVNILASLAGILLFTLLAFLSQPPPVWLAGAGVALVALVWRVPRLRWTALAAMAAVVWLAAQAGSGSPYTYYWSPYQKLGLAPLSKNGEIYFYDLKTNDNWYQQMLNLSPQFVARHPELFQTNPIEWNAYNLPYHFYPNPPRVLVLGAGTGNDVAASLRNGAGEVDAVEIDPLILKLGRDLHFEHPYSSPRVHAIVDDARSYLQTASKRYDLILFSLLDSQTTNAYYSNIRIDNYVYTVEAMRAVRRLLKPDGIMVVKYWVETPWIGGRLLELVTTSFDSPPVQVGAVNTGYGTPGRFFICGSAARIDAAMKDPALAEYVRRRSTFPTESARTTTDDWPYFYQREPGVPTIIVLISAALVPLCWLLLRATGTTGRGIEWHFFFLGAGFLLLETQIISKMALVFGTTWVVNSVVIAALLLLIVGANLVVESRPQFPVAAAYAGIFATTAIAYFTPLRLLLFSSLALKMLAASLVLCLPVFFAGIVFIRSFAAAGFRGEALGSNLFGALVGGLLESASYWFGLRFLLILAAGLYLASWLTLLRRTEPSPARVGSPGVPPVPVPRPQVPS
jgi:spermidine synthase